MATQGKFYDDPGYLVTQLMSLGRSLAAANGTNCQFESPIAFRLRRVRGVVVTAGSTATNTLTIRKATTSLGALAFADSAAGYGVETGDLNISFAAGEEFNILKGTDGTGVAALVAEIQIPVGTELPI